MALCNPPRVAGHHFDISPDEQGRWIVSDAEGLVGGVFLSRRDALRFALRETDGDAECVHVAAEPALAEGEPAPVSRPRWRG